MSCLFDSLSKFANIDSNSIRQIICEYLDNNGKIMEGLDTDFVLSLDIPKDEYIRLMKQSNTWGGGIEIQAACNIWNVRIVIHNLTNLINNKIEFLPINKVVKATINISWNGSHFEAIQF
jgi:hypothetical protein